MQSAQFQLHARIEEQHWWFVARRQIAQSLVHELLPPSRETTIVDVGCGTGANLASLAKQYRCVGIDTSAEAIDLARKQYPGVQFLQGFAPQGLGEIAGQAKLLMLMDVLEHVEHDRELLASLIEAVSPGAYLLVTVPANMDLWSEHDESFGHYRRYDQQTFEQLWQDLPVEPLLTSYFNTRLYPLIWARRRWNRRNGHSAGVAGTDFNLPIKPVNYGLRSLFAGERQRLLGTLRGRRSPYSRGVSLMAVLRKSAS